MAALTQADTSRQVWSQTFELPAETEDPENHAARVISRGISGPDGVISVTHAADFMHKPLDELTITELCDRAAMQWALTYNRDSFADSEQARAVPDHVTTHIGTLMRCNALFESGRFTETIEAAEEIGVDMEVIHALPPIACAYVEEGRLDDARQVVQKISHASPDYTMKFAEWFFSIAHRYGDVAQRYVDGLRKAGLQEG